MFPFLSCLARLTSFLIQGSRNLHCDLEGYECGRQFRYDYPTGEHHIQAQSERKAETLPRINTVLRDPPPFPPHPLSGIVSTRSSYLWRH